MKMLAYFVIDCFKRLGLRSFKKQVLVGRTTRLLRGFGVQFLATPEERCYLMLGEKTVLNAKIIFEAKTGKVLIGDRCYIGSDCSIISRNRIELGNDVTIAWGVTLYDHDSHSGDWRDRARAVRHFYDHYGEPDCFDRIDWTNVNAAPIKICDRVWIGFDVVVLKGVTIGEGAIVGARSVVTRDVAPYTIVVGNPARVVKHLERPADNVTVGASIDGGV